MVESTENVLSTMLADQNKTFREIFVDSSRDMVALTDDQILARLHTLESALNTLRAHQASARMIYEERLKDAAAEKRAALKAKDKDYRITEETRKRWAEEDKPITKKPKASKDDLVKMLADLQKQLDSLTGK